MDKNEIRWQQRFETFEPSPKDTIRLAQQSGYIDYA